MLGSRIGVVAFGACLLLMVAGVSKAQRPADAGATVSPADRQFILDAALSSTLGS